MSTLVFAVEIKQLTRIDRFCTGQVPKTLGGISFSPTQMSVSGMTDEATGSELTLRFPLSLPFVQETKTSITDDKVEVRVWEIDDSSELLVFKGLLSEAKPSNSEFLLECVSVLNDLKRLGLRRTYSRLCPHVLYGSQCGADIALHTKNIVVQFINGIELTVLGLHPDDESLYAGGLLSYETTREGSPVTVQRSIIHNTGSLVVVSRELPTSPTEVAVAKGCSHIGRDCGQIFNNTDNYGGHPYVPTNNPFTSQGAF